MSVNASISIIEIDPAHTSLTSSQNLGSPEMSARLNRVIEATRQRGGKVFELTWRGDKIPRGAVILGKEIGWTQNGMVTDVDGQSIGTYDRLEEFLGEGRDSHRMRIFTRAASQA